MPYSLAVMSKARKNVLDQVRSKHKLPEVDGTPQETLERMNGEIINNEERAKLLKKGKSNF